MRIVTLNALRAGIERLRIKGGAKIDALYDLVNGYVTLDGSIKSRPGTETTVTLPAGTEGMTAFESELVVFSHQPAVIPASTPPARCELVIHPTNPTLPLARIHFAAPIVGALYVAAEFSNGDVFHYWLRSAETWTASTSHDIGDLVQPSTPNGYLYRAHRLRAPGVKWAPKVARTVGDVVEPTAFNGYEYECIDTVGASPRSGETEPVWPTEEGAIVIEDTGRDVAPPPTTGTVTPPTTTLDPDTSDRYDGGIGSRILQ